MDNSGEDKRILVVGGYGAVGSAVCERLAQTVDGRVLVAGRNARAAQRLARRLGDRTEAVQLDVSKPSTYERLLREMSVVVNCVEGHNLAVARRCLARSVHYVDVSATAQILGELQTLQAEADRAGATAVFSVCVAPGLTKLLAKHAQSRRGPLARGDDLRMQEVESKPSLKLS